MEKGYAEGMARGPDPSISGPLATVQVTLPRDGTLAKRQTDDSQMGQPSKTTVGTGPRKSSSSKKSTRPSGRDKGKGKSSNSVKGKGRSASYPAGYGDQSEDHDSLTIEGMNNLDLEGDLSDRVEELDEEQDEQYGLVEYRSNTDQPAEASQSSMLSDDSGGVRDLCQPLPSRAGTSHPKQRGFPPQQGLQPGSESGPFAGPHQASPPPQSAPSRFEPGQSGPPPGPQAGRFEGPAVGGVGSVRGRADEHRILNAKVANNQYAPVYATREQLNAQWAREARQTEARVRGEPTHPRDARDARDGRFDPKDPRSLAAQNDPRDPRFSRDSRDMLELSYPSIEDMREQSNRHSGDGGGSFTSDVRPQIPQRDTEAPVCAGRLSMSRAPPSLYPARAVNHHQRQNNQPIPTNEASLSKIRRRLATYRAECEKLQFVSGLDARNFSNVAQAVQGRAPKKSNRPSSSAQNISARSEQSFVTDVTNETEGTGFTITFNSKTGVETQENVKRQLDPVLKARKDLLRIVGTCQECRTKKIKCSLSHRTLEDLLTDYPDAADDVRWALEYDTGPKQAEQNVTSRLKRSPTGPAPLQTFAEEDIEQAGAQRQDVVVQMNQMFDVSNVELSMYSPDLEFDGVNDVKNLENDSNGSRISLGLPTPTEFCQAMSVGYSQCFGNKMEAQQYLNSCSDQQRSSHQAFAMQQRRSSSNTRFNPGSPLTPSLSYQSSSSAPQSSSSPPMSQTYNSSEAHVGAMPGDFQLHNEPVDVILASIPRPGYTLLFKCEALATGCSMEYGTLQQLIAHIKQHHPQYNLLSPQPFRAVCFYCGIFSPTITTNCMTCAQDIAIYICGTINYESQISSS